MRTGEIIPLLENRDYSEFIRNLLCLRYTNQIGEGTKDFYFSNMQKVITEYLTNQQCINGLGDSTIFLFLMKTFTKYRDIRIDSSIGERVLVYLII